MVPAIRRAWAAALRVGLYCQGDDPDTLRDHTGFNAAGVLCELMHPELWRRWPHCYAFGGNTCMPPPEILSEAGLSESRLEAVLECEDFARAARFIEEDL